MLKTVLPGSRVGSIAKVSRTELESRNLFASPILEQLRIAALLVKEKQDTVKSTDTQYQQVTEGFQLLSTGFQQVNLGEMHRGIEQIESATEQTGDVTNMQLVQQAIAKFDQLLLQADLPTTTNAELLEQIKDFRAASRKALFNGALHNFTELRNSIIALILSCHDVSDDGK